MSAFKYLIYLVLVILAKSTEYFLRTTHRECVSVGACLRERERDGDRGRQREMEIKDVRDGGRGKER